METLESFYDIHFAVVEHAGTLTPSPDQQSFENETIFKLNRRTLPDLYDALERAAKHYNELAAKSTPEKLGTFFGQDFVTPDEAAIRFAENPDSKNAAFGLSLELRTYANQDDESGVVIFLSEDDGAEQLRSFIDWINTPSA